MTNVKTDDHNNTLIKQFRPSNKIETGDSKQLPSQEKDPKIITSPTEVNYHRKVTLKDADIDTNTKGQLEAMCKNYDDIFSKYATDTGKTDLVQISLQPKDNIKPLNQNPYTLPLRHHASLKQELTNLEKSRSNFSIYFKLCKFIVVPKMKDPTTHKITYRMVVDFRKMNEKLRVLVPPPHAH